MDFQSVPCSFTKFMIYSLKLNPCPHPCSCRDAFVGDKCRESWGIKRVLALQEELPRQTAVAPHRSVPCQPWHSAGSSVPAWAPLLPAQSSCSHQESQRNLSRDSGQGLALSVVAFPKFLTENWVLSIITLTPAPASPLDKETSRWGKSLWHWIPSLPESLHDLG